MDRRMRTLVMVFLVTLLLGVLCLAQLPQNKERQAKFHVLDVGQGDSILIESKDGRQILVDAGKDSTVLSELATVLPKGDRSIDVVIATHPDADHIGGLPLVLERYQVGVVLLSEVFTDTEQFRKLHAVLAKKNIPTYYARKGMDIVLSTEDSAVFSILFPDRATPHWETNSASIAGKLTIGESTALFTGDAPASIENFLVGANKNRIGADMLKLGHHGSKTSSSESFLKAVNPRSVIVSAGVDNRYGHPAQEVVERLHKLSVPILSTQDRGTMTFMPTPNGWSLQ